MHPFFSLMGFTSKEGGGSGQSGEASSLQLSAELTDGSEVSWIFRAAPQGWNGQAFTTSLRSALNVSFPRAGLPWGHSEGADGQKPSAKGPPNHWDKQFLNSKDLVQGSPKINRTY